MSRPIRKCVPLMTFSACSITSANRQAHVVGLSMGGFATLHFGLRHPQRALSLCIGGCGYGAEPDQRERFRAEADAIAGVIRAEGMAAFAERYAYGPTRVQYQNKDPRGHAAFKSDAGRALGRSGSANTQQGVQKERPSLYLLIEEMKRLTVPTLIITGDEDWPCLHPRHSHEAGHPVGRARGDPEIRRCHQHRGAGGITGIVGNFLSQVDSGRRPRRDPRAISASITGMKDA